MRQGVILTGLGVAVWAVPTLFFLLFGDWVVLEVGDPYFGSSLFLLEMLSFLLLIGMALIVRLRLLKERGSATRFGFVAAAVGMLLNTFTLWHRESVFPKFNEGQHHAFSVWMTLAYALTLLVPAVVDRLVREPEKVENIVTPEASSLQSDIPIDELEVKPFTSETPTEKV
ncbi:DUF5367 family protein [Cohnella abietis]|uniref:Uncharacterized protein n=1 Tax=Cohnella abietis TaxID=2507935 RepID=A0A3T1D244_9BACL|nr:DUF5367 family protein [Cohnella abietis]BBI32121.1 hypothetical protein KCTCHS21_15200 [Cohnella abietis]